MQKPLNFFIIFYKHFKKLLYKKLEFLNMK